MRFAVLERSADLRVPSRCHQTAQPAQKATELGQGAHALPRSPMIHTGWFRQGQPQPRSRAAAQKLVDRIYAFNPRSWIPGCAVAHVPIGERQTLPDLPSV
jgi:hypothetical protein